MIEPFFSFEIGEIGTWGTNKKVNKQKNKSWKFQYPQPDLEPRHSNEQVLYYTFCGEVLSSFAKLEFSQVRKMRKSPIQSEKKWENHFPMVESEQIAYHDNKSQTWLQYRSQIFVSSTRSARFESEKKSRSLLFLTSEKALRVPKTKILDLFWKNPICSSCNGEYFYSRCLGRSWFCQMWF